MGATNRAIANLSINIVIDQLRDAVKAIGELHRAMSSVVRTYEGHSSAERRATQATQEFNRSLFATETQQKEYQAVLESIANMKKGPYKQSTKELAQAVLEEGASLETTKRIIAEVNAGRRMHIQTILQERKELDQEWRVTNDVGKVMIDLGVQKELATYATRRMAQSENNLTKILRGLGVPVTVLNANMEALINSQHGSHQSAVAASRGWIEMGLRAQILSDQIDELNTRHRMALQSLYAYTMGMRDVGTPMRELQEMMGYTSEEGLRVAESFKEMTIRQQQLSVATRALQVRTGVMGQAWRGLGKSVFWAGLGTMFTVMSISRAIRSQENVRVATKSLEDAKEDETLAWQDAREAIMWYGQGSREASDAIRRAEDASDNVTESQKRLEFQQQQVLFNWLQMGLTVIPTVTQSIGNFLTSLRFMGIALVVNRQQIAGMTNEEMQLATAQLSRIGAIDALRIATSKETLSKWLSLGSSKALSAGTRQLTLDENLESTAKVINTQQTNINTGSQVANNVARWGGVASTLALVGALTLGIGAIVGLTAAMGAQAHATEQAEQSMADLDNTMYGHSLYDSILNVTTVMRDLTSGFAEVRKSADNLDLNIQGQVVELQTPPRPISVEYQPKLEDIGTPSVDVRTKLAGLDPMQGVRMPSVGQTINNFTVHMTNYVRDDSDIVAIRRKLDHLFQVQLRHMGEF